MKETIPVRITRRRYNELKALADKNNTTLTFMLELACSKFIKNSEGVGFLIHEIEDSYDRAIDNFATGKVPGKVMSTPARVTTADEEMNSLIETISATVAPSAPVKQKPIDLNRIFDGEEEV